MKYIKTILKEHTRKMKHDALKATEEHTRKMKLEALKATEEHTRKMKHEEHTKPY